MRTGNIIGLLFLSILVAGASARMLLNRDSEARRLVDLERRFGRIKGDEIELLHKRKRNLVIGYTAFMLIGVGMFIYLMVKLLWMV
jgi:hypothetical protein